MCWVGVSLLLLKKLPCERDQNIRAALHLRRWRLDGAADQVSPDFLRSLQVQRRVVQGHVYPGLESFIKSANSVCGQEPGACVKIPHDISSDRADLQDAFVVFQDAQEDAD
jgi:hypothetical protein